MRQWAFNCCTNCTSPQKLCNRSFYERVLVGKMGQSHFEPNNQNLIKVPKVFKPINKIKTL